MKIQDLVRKELLPIKRPAHGGQGWRYEGVEDFSHNLNPLGPPEALPGLVAEAVKLLDHYPDDGSSLLKGTISEHHDVDERNVIVGAGSAELIRLFPEVFVVKNSSVIMPRPTFSEYAFACRIRGANIMDIPLCEVDEFHFDLSAVIERLPLARALYVCNPNNPTGGLEPRKRLVEIIEECEARNVLVFLDETLLDLVDNGERYSCAAEVENHDNLFLIRSLTKSFAIPGMRVGYGLGSKDIIGFMDRARLSWNLGVIEQYVASKLLSEHMNHVRRAARMMAEEKVRVKEAIDRTGLFAPLADQSFFFFTRVNNVRLNAEDIVQELLPHKVLIRDCSSFGRPFEKFVRFSVKTKEKNDILIKAIETTAKDIRSTAFGARTHV